MGTKLLDLPEECLSLILSFIPPCYVLRCSLVCKALYAVANSDEVWERLVPSELHPYIRCSSSSSASGGAAKHLVLLLCHSFVLNHNEGGNMSLSLDIWTGKKSYMIGARRLTYGGGDGYGCWEGKMPRLKSRFLEVAQLLGVYDLRITGRISTELLSPNTTYRVCFSFMLDELSCGFDLYPIRVFVSKIDLNGQYIGGGYDTSKTYYLKAPTNRDMFEGLKCEVGSNWTKIDMGKYYNGGDSDVGVLEMTLVGTEIGVHKSGLVVHAIELLPVD